jgi:hypothetical protein
VSSTPPRKGVDIDQWITEWDSLREQTVSLNIPEIKSANKDFLRAVKDILPVWWQLKFEAIVLHQEEWDTRELIENFRGTYREMQPQKAISSLSKASFSTLQGFEDKDEESHRRPSQERSSQERSLPPIPKRFCPCGFRYHKPWNCWIVNREAYPDKPVSKEKLKRVKERLAKNEPGKAWIEKMVKEHNNKNGIKPTANSTQFYGSFFATSLSTSQLTAENNVKERWFLNTASSVHMCN